MKNNTYKNVCGDNNPFDGISGVADYGKTAGDYHTIMLARYSQMPVINDYNTLQLQIAAIFAENAEIWRLLYATIPTQIEPNAPFTESEQIHHSGSDNTKNDITTTDKRNTFDNATLRTVGEVTNDNSGGITYGHIIETQKTKYDGSPLTQLEKYRKLAGFNMTETIIKTVITGISRHIFIINPSNN